VFSIHRHQAGLANNIRQTMASKRFCYFG